MNSGDFHLHLSVISDCLI